MSTTQSKCPECHGKGNYQIKRKKKCPQCRGMGSTKLIIGGGKPKAKDVCPNCKGTGKLDIIQEKNCKKCSGTGVRESHCMICQKPHDWNRGEVCEACQEKTSLYQLIPPVTKASVEINSLFLSKIVSIVDFGYFVQLAPQIEGLIRDKKFPGKIDDILVVRLKHKKGEKLEFERIAI